MQRRLFIAIQLPESMRSALSAYKEQYGQWSDVRWVRPENLHITLLFLGDVDEVHIAPLAQQLSTALCDVESFYLRWDAIIYFPPKKYPHMIWVRFHTNELYRQLIKRIRLAVRPFLQNWKEESREDIPHITLARFSQQHARSDELTQIAGQDLLVSSCALMASELTPEGPVYSTLAFYQLREH